MSRVTQSYKEELKEKYFASKEQLDQLRSNITLVRWKILSEAYKYGKKIWGHLFSVKRLAEDMDMAYTTVKRCLALDKATPESWQLVKEKKLSAFKLAQICLTKNNAFQKEIVEAVIEDNISTHKIKGLKINSVKDVNVWRHKQAVAKGYASKDAAYRSFNVLIMRFERLLLLDSKRIPVKHRAKIKKDLSALAKKINVYAKGL